MIKLTNFYHTYSLIKNIRQESHFDLDKCFVKSKYLGCIRELENFFKLCRSTNLTDFFLFYGVDHKLYIDFANQTNQKYKGNLIDALHNFNREAISAIISDIEGPSQYMMIHSVFDKYFKSIFDLSNSGELFDDYFPSSKVEYNVIGTVVRRTLRREYHKQDERGNDIAFSLAEKTYKVIDKIMVQGREAYLIDEYIYKLGEERQILFIDNIFIKPNSFKEIEK